MIPVFKLQITDLEGNVVQLPAGGPLERDFILAVSDQIMNDSYLQRLVSESISDEVVDMVTDVIRTYGIGLFTSTDKVAERIKSGMRGPLRDQMVIKLANGLRSVIIEAMTKVIRDLKFETVKVR